jgi:hypothetical protein
VRRLHFVVDWFKTKRYNRFMVKRAPTQTIDAKLDAIAIEIEMACNEAAGGDQTAMIRIVSLTQQKALLVFERNEIIRTTFYRGGR